MWRWPTKRANVVCVFNASSELFCCSSVPRSVHVCTCVFGICVFVCRKILAECWKLIEFYERKTSDDNIVDNNKASCSIKNEPRKQKWTHCLLQPISQCVRVCVWMLARTSCSSRSNRNNEQKNTSSCMHASNIRWPGLNGAHESMWTRWLALVAKQSHAAASIESLSLPSIDIIRPH